MISSLIALSVFYILLFSANASQVEEFELEEETGLSRKRRGLPPSTLMPQDWFQRDVDAISKSVEVPHYDFVQEPGDMFFLPNGFTHGTMDLTPRTIGIIFRGNMTVVGEEELNFTPLYKDVQHLPWRPVLQVPGPNSFPRLPSPRSHINLHWQRWQRVAGGTKYFSNSNLDYRYSEKHYWNRIYHSFSNKISSVSKMWTARQDRTAKVVEASF